MPFELLPEPPAVFDFMLTTHQVELAAISSSKGKSLDLAAFG